MALLLCVCVSWTGAGIYVTREELADVIRTVLGLHPCPCGCGQPLRQHTPIRSGGAR